MNLDQLRDSLSEHDPRPSDVLGAVHRKRRAARNRMYAASGGLAVVAVAIVAGLLVRGIPLGAASSSSSSSAASGALAPAAAPASGSSGTAAGSVPAAGPAGSSLSCAAVTLRQDIAMAVRSGGSVIVGYGTPTGKSVPAGASAGGGSYYAVTLRSVQTLAGPAIRSGSTAWIVAASTGRSSSPEGQTLWAPNGELFAIASPAAAAGNAPVGPVLRSAPVIGGQVIFSPDECWSVAGLPAKPYAGSQAAVFGAPSGTGSERASASAGGVTAYAVPLAAVEKVARQQ